MMSSESVDLIAKSQKFAEILVKETSLSPEARSRVQSFYEAVLKENEIQNLTRLTEPLAFFEGHLIDVLELLKTGWLEGVSLDLGSGVGVPGLLAALIREDHWILSESEKKKAEYLSRTANTLGLDGQVQVTHHRAEEYLRTHSVKTVVARAVGPVERIYGWIRSCSTWNNLILFKGPGWDEEWKRFQESRLKSELLPVNIHEYSVGNEQKIRKIIQLKRVPRGTISKKT